MTVTFQPDRFGTRARIGLVYMASSVVMEPEMYAMASEDVSIHTSRLTLPSVTVEGIDAMMNSPELESAVRLCAQAPLEVIIFGGTSASFLHGTQWDNALTQKMAEWTPIPATTTSTASLNALREVNAEKIALVTPYVPEVVSRAERFFGENGFPVVRSKGLSITEVWDLAEVPLEKIYEMCLEIDGDDISAIFISCTNLRSVGAIQAIEKAINKPVVSAIQASFWHCLKMSNATGGARPGYGRLFDSMLE